MQISEENIVDRVAHLEKSVLAGPLKQQKEFPELAKPPEQLTPLEAFA